MDYQNSRIYRLTCNNTGKQYVGSTTQPLNKRKALHKRNYTYWASGGERSYVSSFEIVVGGNYDIVLIEDFPCETKEQLHARERYWIENTECVNKTIPGRTNKMYVEEHREHLRKWKKNWDIENKEKMDKYHANYRQANRERIRQQNTQKFDCECGGHYNYTHKIRHLQSKKHQAYEAQNNA